MPAVSQKGPSKCNRCIETTTSNVTRQLPSGGSGEPRIRRRPNRSRRNDAFAVRFDLSARLFLPPVGFNRYIQAILRAECRWFLGFLLLLWRLRPKGCVQSAKIGSNRSPRISSELALCRLRVTFVANGLAPLPGPLLRHCWPWAESRSAGRNDKCRRFRRRLPPNPRVRRLPRRNHPPVPSRLLRHLRRKVVRTRRPLQPITGSLSTFAISLGRRSWIG